MVDVELKSVSKSFGKEIGLENISLKTGTAIRLDLNEGSV